MELKTLEKLFHKDLDALYGKEEVSSFFMLTIEHYFSISRLQLALDPNMSITKEEQDVFFKVLNALKKEKPIQYILGTTEFYGLPFMVNENTLIPRPETEELVNWVIDSVKSNTETSKKNTNVCILDIGTGSGCIAVSLARSLPNASVYALDVSKNALKIAERNAALNAVKVHFLEMDILNFKTAPEVLDNLKFDVIVSNPPYVRTTEKSQMKANVLNNEPHLALFVEHGDPLIFYRKILGFAEDKLKANGELFFEINEYLGEETKALIENRDFSPVELKKDLFGKDRMLRGFSTSS